jgi:hypothetical protein
MGGKMFGEHRAVFGGKAPWKVAVALALWPLSAFCAEPFAEPCAKIFLGESRITAIEDSRTLALEDGRKIRLARIEWAVPPAEALAVLSDLLLNRPVTLAAPERSEPDRYGRLYAFPSVSGSETPIQYG